MKLSCYASETARRALLASLCLLALGGCGGGKDVAPPDLDASADARASALVARMTLDEKVQLVHGAGFGSSPLRGGGFIPGIPRLGIPDLNTTDGTGGVSVEGAEATALPSQLGLAASWDPDLAFAYGAIVAKEARALGFVELLGGGINLIREPRGGRSFEYLGEDPVLTGLMATQRTLGVQTHPIVSTVKHFALNGQETRRFDADSRVDERTLRELYLLGFEEVVKQARPGNVMCAYNLVNGTKACENAILLTDILKTEWGFQGKVQSDWGLAVTDTVKAANAGLDEEQPGAGPVPNGFDGFSRFTVNLKSSVQIGAVPAARLDDMVQRKLRGLFRAGVMDAPPTPGGRIDREAGNLLARQVAEQSMVLLKNQDRLLPLSASIASIAVIGGHADAGVLSGGGSASVPPPHGPTVACRTPGATKGNLGFFSACAAWYPSAPLAAIRAKAPQAAVTFHSGEDAAAAAAAAAAADVTVVFATQWQGEDWDLDSLALPSALTDPSNQAYDQNALIAAVAARAKRLVVVLQHGTAVTMPWLDQTHAVLAAWYPGAQGGPAIANVLFGEVNPSGKLPLTFPRSEADLPQPVIPTGDTVVYGEGLNMGYRWFDARAITPLFAFGHGLSYTSFAYSGLSIHDGGQGDVRLRLTLRNTGSRAGADVVQVYASLPAAANQPPKRLVAWRKVMLAAGASTTVDISVPARRFAVWDVTAKAWHVPPGTFGLQVGGSSADPAQTGSVVLAGRRL